MNFPTSLNQPQPTPNSELLKNFNLFFYNVFSNMYPPPPQEQPNLFPDMNFPGFNVFPPQMQQPRKMETPFNVTTMPQEPPRKETKRHSEEKEEKNNKPFVKPKENKKVVSPKKVETKNDNSEENKEKTHSCNCNKTNCLKLYCECFANGEFCGQICNCLSCNNNDKNIQLRNQIISNIKMKSPFAFEKKFQPENEQKRQNNKGCTCKKSKCRKKYCDCFLENLFCGSNCKCESCLNRENEEGDNQLPLEKITKKIKLNEKSEMEHGLPTQ